MNPFKRPIRTDIRFDTAILYCLVLASTLLTLGIGTLSALSAAYKALFRRLKTGGDETDRVNTFIRDMKKTLPESVIVFIVIILVTFGAVYLLRLNDTSYRVIGLIVILESLIVLFYGAAGLALFNYKRVVFVFKTALLMGHLHVLTSAKLFAGLVFTAAIAYLLNPFIIILVFPFIIYTTAHAFHPVFKIYTDRIEADETVNKANASSQGESKKESGISESNR